MSKYKISSQNKDIIEFRLGEKYKTIGSLQVDSINIYQLESVNKGMITTIKFEYGFISKSFISFIYVNDELFSVTGLDVSMSLIEYMKDLLKVYLWSSTDTHATALYYTVS